MAALATPAASGEVDPEGAAFERAASLEWLTLYDPEPLQRGALRRIAKGLSLVDPAFAARLMYTPADGGVRPDFVAAYDALHRADDPGARSRADSMLELLERFREIERDALTALRDRWPDRVEEQLGYSRAAAAGAVLTIGSHYRAPIGRVYESASRRVVVEFVRALTEDGPLTPEAVGLIEPLTADGGLRMDPVENRLGMRWLLERAFAPGDERTSHLVLTAFNDLFNFGWRVRRPFGIGLSDAPELNVLSALLPNRAWFRERTREYLAECARLAAAPTAESIGGRSVGDWVAGLPIHTRFYFATLADGYDSIIGLCRDTLTQGRAAQLALHVRLFEGERGRLPATLDEVAAAYPERFPDGPPVDMWAPGGRFVYRVVDTGAGPEPLLYSVGRDGEDDGGEPSLWDKFSLTGPGKNRDWVILGPGYTPR